MSDDRVLMRDPNSPDSPPYEAVPSQVPFLAASGWVEVERGCEAEQADAEPAAETKKTERPKASAAQKKENG